MRDGRQDSRGDNDSVGFNFKIDSILLLGNNNKSPFRWTIQVTNGLLRNEYKSDIVNAVI